MFILQVYGPVKSSECLSVLGVMYTSTNCADYVFFVFQFPVFV